MRNDDKNWNGGEKKTERNEINCCRGTDGANGLNVVAASIQDVNFQAPARYP